jgi:hypothetical protein
LRPGKDRTVQARARIDIGAFVSAIEAAAPSSNDLA